MKTKQMTYDAMLAALCAVLGLVSLDFGNLKITFEDLPILIAAALFGPWDGMIVGVLGTTVYQMLRFGPDPTLPLWVVPLALGGLLAGWIARKNEYSLEGKNPFVMMISAELFITFLNTISLVIYSKMYGFFTPAYILAPLLSRIFIGVAKGTVFAKVLSPVIEAIRKTFRVEGKQNISHPNERPSHT